MHSDTCWIFNQEDIFSIKGWPFVWWGQVSWNIF
jgi:hypothetical protein